MNEDLQKKQDELRERAFNYKGNFCKVCGHSTRAALLFVAVNKKLSGSNTQDWEVIKGDLDKSVIMCRNCYEESVDTWRREKVAVTVSAFTF